MTQETLETKARRLGADMSEIWDLIRNSGGRVPHKLNMCTLKDVLPQITNINAFAAKGMWLFDGDGEYYDFYTTSEVNQMSEMPTLPTGAVGWTMTIAQAKTELASKTYILVGVYPSHEAILKFDLNLTDSSKLSPSVAINFSTDSVNNRIDWGDGTTSVISGTGMQTTQHTYSAIGDYEVKVISDDTITVGSSNGYRLLGTSSTAKTYSPFLDNIYVSEDVSLDSYCFNTGYSDSEGTYGPTHVYIDRSKTSLPYQFLSYNKSLLSFVVPDAVTSIGNYAFATNLNMTDIALPNGVVYIGDYCFYQDWELENISFNPSGYVTVGGGAFYSCYGLKPISFLDKIVAPNSNTFYDAGKNLSDSDRIALHLTRDIADNIYSFEGCSWFNALTVDSDIEKIPSFSKTGIDNFDFSNATLVTEIPSDCCRNNATFPSTSDTCTILLPPNTTTIGGYAFASQHLTSLVLPNTVTSIGAYAFLYVNSFTTSQRPAETLTIHIPASVTSLGQCAFQCAGVDRIIFDGQAPTLKEYSLQNSLLSYAYAPSGGWHPVIDFSNCTSIPTLESATAFGIDAAHNIYPTIIVPDSLYDSWIVATNWSSIAQYIVKESEA